MHVRNGKLNQVISPGFHKNIFLQMDTFVKERNGLVKQGHFENLPYKISDTNNKKSRDNLMGNLLMSKKACRTFKSMQKTF